MSVKEQMTEARDLIKAKRYDEARAILETVDHPLAEQWLDKINVAAPSGAEPKKDTPDWLGDMQADTSSPLLGGKNPRLDDDVVSAVRATSASRLLPSIIGAVIGAAIGSAVWAVVAIVTDYETTLVAIGVGVLAGFGALLGAGMKRGIPFQVVAAVAAVIGIFIGKYLFFYHIVTQSIAEEFGQELMAEVGFTLFSPEIIQDFMDFLPELFEFLDIVFIGLAILVAFGIPSVRREKTAKITGTAQMPEVS